MSSKSNPIKPSSLTNEQHRFIPVTEWKNFHSWPPIGGLRHLIFHAKQNGFDRCIVRAGRRVLVDESAFFEWLEAGRGGVK